MLIPFFIAETFYFPTPGWCYEDEGRETLVCFNCIVGIKKAWNSEGCGASYGGCTNNSGGLLLTEGAEPTHTHGMALYCLLLGHI